MISSHVLRTSTCCSSVVVQLLLTWQMIIPYECIDKNTKSTQIMIDTFWVFQRFCKENNVVLLCFKFFSCFAVKPLFLPKLHLLINNGRIFSNNERLYLQLVMVVKYISFNLYPWNLKFLSHNSTPLNVVNTGLKNKRNIKMLDPGGN